MESSFIKIILFLLCLSSLCSCKNKDSERKDTTINASLLENGDIICRLGNGMFSNLFRLQSKEKIYSHAGIIYIDESNSFFVIHAEANELTGIGFTKAEPLQSFLDNSKEWGIYRLKKDSASRKQISTEALHYVERQAPFDMAFDLLTDSKVYCTELVALSINKALNNTLITPGKTLSDRLFYAIDDIYLHEEMERLAVSSK